MFLPQKCREVTSYVSLTLKIVKNLNIVIKTGNRNTFNLKNLSTILALMSYVSMEVYCKRVMENFFFPSHSPVTQRKV